MKKRRQEAILEIIEKYDLSTQDELLQKLKDSGFDATQATVSRDIRAAPCQDYGRKRAV